jgi:hypothetical protein
LEARVRAAENKPVPVWRQLRMHLRGWLCAAAPSIYQYPQSAPRCASELRRLLAEPEMRALLMQNRYVGDSLKRVCRGLLVDLSLLYPEPDEAPAPVAAEPEPMSAPAPEPTIALPDEIGPQPPASAAIVLAPGENDFPGAASAPPLSTAEGDKPPFPSRVDGRGEGDIFRRG